MPHLDFEVIFMSMPLFYVFFGRYFSAQSLSPNAIMEKNPKCILCAAARMPLGVVVWAKLIVFCQTQDSIFYVRLLALIFYVPTGWYCYISERMAELYDDDDDDNGWLVGWWFTRGAGILTMCVRCY